MSNPLITSTSPGNLETNVANNSVIEVTFNQTMDPATITTLTMILSIDGDFLNTVSRTVVYNLANNKATVIPDTILANNTIYRMLVVGATDPEASVLTGVKNALGEPMVGNISWTFTTGMDLFVIPSGDPTIYTPAPPSSEADIGPLLITKNDPEDLAYNVVQSKVITVNFNDDLWIENDAVIETLPSGAYADPTGWLLDSIEITAKPVLGEQIAGFTPITPSFDVGYDWENNKLSIIPTSSGYVGSYYAAGKYVPGTLTSGSWEPSTDYEITILGNRMKGLATTIMEDDYTFLFTTLMVPMYVSVESIRLSLGAFIDGVPDNTIAVMIHLNSIKAQELGIFDWLNPPIYVVNYVLCKTKLDLLTAVFLGAGGLGTGRRTLGDMTIEQDAGSLSDFITPLLEQLGNCVNENEELIENQGQVKGPKYAVPHVLAGDPYPGTAWARLGSPDSVNDRLLKPGTTNRNRDNPPFPFRIARRNI